MTESKYINHQWENILTTGQIVREFHISQFEQETKEHGSQFWIENLGQRHIPIGQLEKVLRSLYPSVQPLRTGHNGGGLELMAQGIGEGVAFNLPIFESGLGRPLIVDMTKTPNRHLVGEQHNKTEGDFLYFPGSILDNDIFIHLELFTFNGKKFMPFDRSDSLFSPFLFVKNGGEMMPLQQVHRKRNNNLGLAQEMNYMSDYLIAAWNKVSNVTRIIVENIIATNDPSLLSLLIDKSITIDGKVHTPILNIEDGKINFNGKLITQEDLLTQLLTLTEVIAGHKSLDDLQKMFGNEYLYFNSDFFIFLVAILNADMPNGNGSKSFFDPHFHWGGMQMAGAPPYIKGYVDDGIKKNMQTLMNLVKDQEIPEVGKIKSSYLLLMPAPIYLLYPDESDSLQTEAINNLVQQVIERCGNLRTKSTQKHQDMVEVVVQDWLGDHSYNLSKAFVSRFNNTTESTGPNYLKSLAGLKKTFPSSRKQIKPEAFDLLTTKEAILIAGYLMTHHI